MEFRDRTEFRNAEFMMYLGEYETVLWHLNLSRVAPPQMPCSPELLQIADSVIDSIENRRCMFSSRC